MWQRGLVAPEVRAPNVVQTTGDYPTNWLVVSKLLFGFGLSTFDTRMKLFESESAQASTTGTPQADHYRPPTLQPPVHERPPGTRARQSKRDLQPDCQGQAPSP